VIRFCVVDDHMIVHDGLRAMADRENDLNFAGAASALTDALALVRDARPDVVLLDLRLDGESSTDLCAELTAQFPAVAVVIFSAYGNAELVAQAVRAGAAGYVLKETNTARLPDIMREVATTGTYFDPRLAGSLLRKSLTSTARPDAFNERELAIVGLIARGVNNHDIGAELNISSHTVKFHVTTMLRRHGQVRARPAGDGPAVIDLIGSGRVRPGQPIHP
jgi:two-component system response regulator DevR